MKCTGERGGGETTAVLSLEIAAFSAKIFSMQPSTQRSKITHWAAFLSENTINMYFLQCA